MIRYHRIIIIKLDSLAFSSMLEIANDCSYVCRNDETGAFSIFICA